jgi:hypothetical protein
MKFAAPCRETSSLEDWIDVIYETVGMDEIFDAIAQLNMGESRWFNWDEWIKLRRMIVYARKYVRGLIEE